MWRILCIGMLGLAGCLPEPLAVDNIPQLKPKIVVSTQITSDQSIAILLTKSVGALDASDDSDPAVLLDQIALNDATVVIYHNDEFYPLALVESGLYMSTDVPLEPGELYRLIVNSASLGTVTSSTRAMEPVQFEFIEATIYDNGYDTLAEVSYSFNDLPGKNFYMFNVQHVTREVEPEDLLNPDIYTNLMEANPAQDGLLHSYRHRVAARRDFMPGDTIGVFLSNISKPYYDFMQLRLDSRFNFADFLGEPANYPSNIDGGLGFFNLYIPDVRILELE
jgi:hypothetical protein